MSRIGRYEVHQPPIELGVGGMGTVVYGVDPALNREVALKCLRPEVANNPGVIERFRKEAQAQAKLNDTNIAQIWEFFQVGSQYYLAMEFINGPTLAQVLRENIRLPFEEAGNYCIHSLRGLDHAHKRGIVHRDIKPGNLMLNKEGQIKVTDFGIAHVRGASRETRAGTIIGTYEYISPEAAQGLESTAVSDLYSIGVVLFEMITGRLPFNSQGEFELLRMHIEAPCPAVRSFIREVPAELDGIVLKAMNKKVGRRFRSAEEMADALQNCLFSGNTRTLPTGWWARIGLGGAPVRERTTPAPEATDRRRADVSSICHRVEDLIEQYHFNEAAAILDAGIRGYPGEPDFIDMGNRLQRQRQQYEQTVVQQAELTRDFLKRGFPEEAMRVVGNAVRLYPRSTELIDLQQECRRRMDLASASASEMAQVQGKVDELIAAGLFQEAADYVLDLTRIHENQTELNKLLARILQARKDAEKQAAIQHHLTAAEEAACAGEWESALRMLDAGLSRFPGDPQIQHHRQDLNDRWRAELVRRAVEEALSEARMLETSTSLPAARDRLTRELDTLGQQPPLIQELERIDAAIEASRRDASIRSAIAAAVAMQEERQWHAALEVLDQTVMREGGDPRIDELRGIVAAELRANEARVARASAHARQLIQDFQWEEAVMRLSTSVREFPGEQTLIDLMNEAQRGLAQSRREESIARIKLEAEKRTRRREYTEALRLLLDAMSQYPEDATLSAALSQTIFERDAYLADKKANAALERASTLRQEGHFEPAIEVLRETLRELPDYSDLLSALSGLEREWREIHRRETIEAVSLVVEASLATEDYPPALDKLAAELTAWPDDPELAELRRRTLAAQRQTQVRQALLDTLKKAESLEDGQQWDAAVELYTETLAGFPETASQLESRLANVRNRAAEARGIRRAALERQIGDRIEAGQLEEAEGELQMADREFPGDASFITWREVLSEERRRIARETAVRNAVNKARGFLERKSFQEAENVLTAAGRECGADPALRELWSSVQGAKRGHLAEIESALRGISALLEKRDWNGAISAAALGSEQFPDQARFRDLLEAARQQRESERHRRKEVDRSISQIDALLSEDAFGEAELLINTALREYADEAEFSDRRQRLEERRRVRALEIAFRQSRAQVDTLRDQRRWEQARQLLVPYLDGGPLQTEAQALAVELSEMETQYLTRTRGLEGQARSLIAGKQGSEALTLLEMAVAQFPEIEAFSQMLGELREYTETEQKDRNLGAAERSIRSLMADRQYQAALEEADRVLGDYPGEVFLRDLRAVIVAGIGEQAALARVAEEVERLVAAGQGAESDRVLVEGLRKYPGRLELERLRPAVDRTRKAEWDRQSREAGLKRAISAIDELLRSGQLPEASLELEALEAEYGKEAASEVAERVRTAVSEAERKRLAEEERARESERERLAAEAQARELEQQRLAAEERERKLEEARAREAEQERLQAEECRRKSEEQRVREAERERLEAEVRERTLEEERTAQALALEFRQSADKVGRLCQQRQWEEARQLVTPFLENARTKPSAEAVLEELARQEALHQARPRELEERGRALLAAHRYEKAAALFEQAIREFPENEVFPRLLEEARAGLAGEQKAQRLQTAESAIRALLAEQRFNDALHEAATVSRDYPGERAIQELLATVAERSAVAGLAREVHRLIAAREWTEADRVVADALRRYPGRTEVENLRAALAASPRTQPGRSQETGLQRAVSKIEKLLKGKPAEEVAGQVVPEQQPGPRTTAGASPRITKPYVKSERGTKR